MPTDADNRLEERVIAAAEAALAERQFVTAIDVLLGLGWLPRSSEQAWRQGRIPYLEAAVTANLSKVSRAMRFFRRWARRAGLKPAETAYVARSPGRRTLRFSKSGDASIERAYRTHWLSPRLSERKSERLLERRSKPPDLVVIAPINDWTCAACGGTGGLLIMDAPGPLCLTCADLDHLVYLPAGDAALTRRARAESCLSAVVVRFSRARKRYERQGILVEEEALQAAEQQCLADEDARARRRERDADRRVAEDAHLRERFAAEIIRLFPGCPAPRASAIARHAATRGSGRVGRSAAGRAVDAGAVELAVIASVRHEDTEYDELLMAGIDRAHARERVRGELDRTLKRWRRG
jgi:hypothetical protein